MLSGASTSQIQDTLTSALQDISNNFGAQMKWLESHPDFDFAQIAKERDLLALRAIGAGFFYHIFNDAKCEDVRNKTRDGYAAVARTNDQPALSFQLYHKPLGIPDDVAAYAIGIIECKWGWRGKIELIEELLNENRHRHSFRTSDGQRHAHPAMDGVLIKIADAGVKGVFEGSQFENKTEAEDFLRYINDPLLHQTFLTKLNEIYTNKNENNEMPTMESQNTLKR